MYIINKHYLVNLKWEFSKGKINLAQHFRKKRESDIYNPIHIYQGSTIKSFSSII